MKKVYLDHNATTPIDPRVREKMIPYLDEEFGNPSSESHAWGWNAQKAVETARQQIAHFLRCKPHELYFTSGSTESVNLAITGIALQRILNAGSLEKSFAAEKRPHFLTTSTEHACVLGAFDFIQKLGAEIEILPVNQYGQLDPQTLRKHLRSETVLVSAIWVNNEIGTINPIHELGKICREQGVLFHSDATQAPGKLELDLENTPIDLLSLSAHKAHGPKGVGALFVRSKNPRIELQALFHGGGQERKVRPGTLNVAGIVGFGEALRILDTEWKSDLVYISQLRDTLFQGLSQIFPDLKLNGHPTERSCANLNISLPSFSLDLAAPHLLGIAMSRGSACQSGHNSGSHVLQALGLDSQSASRSLRLSLGKTTTLQDIEIALEIFKNAREKTQASSLISKPELGILKS